MASGEEETPHTPWAWVPHELEDDSPSQPGHATLDHSAHQPQQPRPVESLGWPSGSTVTTTTAGTSRLRPGSGHHAHGLLRTFCSRLTVQILF
jgi:hypothetical protein